jgi:hypothetical protein
VIEVHGSSDQYYVLNEHFLNVLLRDSQVVPRAEGRKKKVSKLGEEKKIT